MNNKALIVLILILFSCSNDSEEPGQNQETDTITTDISVSTSEDSISWLNTNDLLEKLNASISFNKANIDEDRLENNLNFNADTTQVVASIDFKNQYKDLYIDVNPENNSITIQLDKIVENEVVTLKADGSGATYELITNVLAPNHDPIETPDCGHTEFGRHIDEVFDNEINTNVFRFQIHVEPDNDRCRNFDRQRNEIKSYDKSPDNLLGVENETVIYKWKFKLASGFQSSPNFTHLHQLKSVGGPLESMPMYTLTTRKSSPDRLELRYAETDSQITLKQTDLAPLINEWLEVTEIISYGFSGKYHITITKVSDGSVLFEYSNDDIINWRANATFVRPKWGIYRSLLNAQDLRDEIVLFADFRIEEL